MPTRVEWCDETLNPWAGCTKVSPGCDNCCALPWAKRHIGKKHPKYMGTVKDGEWSGQVNFQPSVLDALYNWRGRRRVFIQIMGDAFHHGVDILDFAQVMVAIHENQRHTCMMLTKRPLNMKMMIESYYGGNDITEPFPNLWLGVTAENQEQANKRIPILLETPAAKRFVSIEPMLGPVRLEEWLPQLDNVIIGAETGPGKRPMKQEWAISVYQQCYIHRTPFFGKKDSNGDPLKIYGEVIRELAE